MLEYSQETIVVGNTEETDVVEETDWVEGLRRLMGWGILTGLI